MNWLPEKVSKIGKSLAKLREREREMGGGIKDQDLN